MATTHMALSLSSPLSLSVSPRPGPFLISLHLPFLHFPTFSSKTRLTIQRATKEPKETATPASASTQQSSDDPKKGVALYKPKSYEVLVTDAANSLAYALQDGKTRLEIDFPYVFYTSFFYRLLLIFGYFEKVFFFLNAHVPLTY